MKYSIVATNHCGPDAPAALAALKLGDKVQLVRERDNKVDPNAVMVWANGKHVGYLPAKQNKAIANYIDQEGLAWRAPVGHAMATDESTPPRASIEATFAPSANSGFPQVELP